MKGTNMTTNNTGLGLPVATVRVIAERVDKARRNRDWALLNMLLRPYMSGTVERQQIDAELRAIAEENRTANPPTYFN